MRELKLLASDDTLHTLLDSLREYLGENGASEENIVPVLISAEEIFVNIAHYAYGGKAGEAYVGMDILSEPKRIRVVFKDGGAEYNPLEKEDPDITLSAEERSIGGLGIFMTKNFMDNLVYEYKDGQNILTMEKNI